MHSQGIWTNAETTTLAWESIVMSSPQSLLRKEYASISVVLVN